MSRSFFGKIQRLYIFLKKSKIVVIDKINNVEDDVLKNVQIKTHNHLSFPSEIYLEIFIKALFLKIFKGYKFRIAYYVSFINTSKPKAVLTFTDNNIFFYSIKKLCNVNATFFSHQNGWRGNLSDLFDKKLNRSLRKYKLSCDYIFCFSNLLKDLYGGLIDSKVITSGCYINNKFKKIIPKNKKIKKLVYISTSDFNVKDRYKIENEKFFSYEIEIIRFLLKYCIKKKILLYIYPKFKYSHEGHIKEKKFFSLNLDKKYFNKNWFLIKKKNPFDIYKNVNKYDLFVSTDSTLGYELLARNVKCMLFRARVDYLKKKFNINFSKSFEHGWPNILKKKSGEYWSNEYDLNIFEKILNNVSSYSVSKWKYILNRDRYNLYYHDYKNRKFLKILNKIVND